MRSDIVWIDNNGKGFEEAIEQTKKIAEFEGVGEMETIRLQVLAEEMLSLARSVTGELQASFWIEMEDMQAVMHMTTRTELNKEERAELIASSTSRKNEAATSFLGKLRDRIEMAIAAEPTHYIPSADLMSDLPFGLYEEQEWDGYERSILRRMADNVSIGIKGDVVDIVVTKRLDVQE